MGTFYIDAIDQTDMSVAETLTITDDLVDRVNWKTAFTSLVSGRNYKFRLRSADTDAVLFTSTTMLDLIAPTAVRAFGFRLLRQEYGVASPCVDVRRDSDNAVASIPFKLYGARAYPYWIDEDALLAHVGSNSGFITNWHDQSTLGIDFTQTTPSRQPRIVNAGVIERINGMPAAFFDGVDDILNQNTPPGLASAGAVTVSFVHNINPDNGFENYITERSSTVTSPAWGIINSGNSPNQHQIGIILRNDANTTIISNATLGTQAFNGTPRQVTIRNTGSQFQAFIAGANGTNINYTPSGTYTMDRFAIGGSTSASGTFSSAPGHWGELVIYLSSLSNANMNVINASQGEAYGITVSPFLTPVEQLTSINGTGDGGGSFAVGLSGIADWEEPRFLDRAKVARGWQRPNGESTPLANRDSEGALASLPAGDTTQNFFFSSFRDGGGGYVGTQPDRGGRFRVTITGGSSSLSGLGISNIAQINSTTWEFDCDWIGNKILTFTPTAFPIKVSIVKTTDLAAYNAGGIFTQQFLDHLPSGGCFRFMDWMRTNNSTVVNWSDYGVFASQGWGRVPLEVIVALCEQKNADMWINIPHLASDALVTAWAEYLRDNFDPARKIRVELSNEIWNFMFGQATHFGNQALSTWGTSGGTNWLSAAGKRFAEIMQIFNTVFAGQTHRVIGVLAGQAAGSGIASGILNAPDWLAADPANYVAPHTFAKEWSIAPYIGWTSNPQTRSPAIKAQLDISQAAAVSYLKGMFPDSLQTSKNYVDSHIAVAASRNLRLTFYEYNNHYDLQWCDGYPADPPTPYPRGLYSAPNTPVAGALDAFIEATFSQEMADAQDELRAYSKSQGVSLMAFFVDMGRASRFGTWGAKTHLEHNSLIWNDLVAWHAANPRWWTQ